MDRLLLFAVKTLFEFREVLDGADHLAGVGVLVVVPGNNLHQRRAVADGHALGLGRVKQRTERDADNVGGHDFVFGVAEGSGRSGLHGGVDRRGVDFTFADRNELGQGAGGHGNALCATVENAVELGNNQTDGFRGTRGVGNDVDGSGARTTQVALSVGAVENHLVAREGVDGRHITLLDLAELVEGVGHRREAVGRAGSRGDDLIVLGQRVLVHGEDNRLDVAGGSGDNDLLGARIDVRHGFLFGAVETGAFEDDVHVQLAPRAVDGVFLFVDLDFGAVHDDGMIGVAHLVRILISALSRVIFEQVREHFGVGQIVDRDDFIAGRLEHLSERRSADTAESVDCNFNVCHNKNSSKKFYTLFLFISDCQ